MKNFALLSCPLLLLLVVGSVTANPVYYPEPEAPRHLPYPPRHGPIYIPVYVPHPPVRNTWPTRFRRQIQLNTGLDHTFNPSSQTSLNLNAQGNWDDSGRNAQGSLSATRSWGQENQNSLTGNLGVDHSRLQGFPSQTNFNSGLGYTFNPNDRTSLNVNAQRSWGSDGTSTGGSLSATRSWGQGNQHSLTSTLGVDHSTPDGSPSQTDYNTGLRYSFNPSSRTSLNLDAQRNWGPGGSSNNYMLGLTHRFN